MSRKIGCVLIAVLPGAWQVSAAAAQAAAAGVVEAQLAVEADARCATTASIEAQVRARSQRIAFVGPAHDVPRLKVTIGGPAGGDRVATLVVRWPDGRSAERRLTAASCTSAAQALALLVAMTLDPAAFAVEPVPAASAPSTGGAGAGGSSDSSGTSGVSPANDSVPSEADATGDAAAPSATRDAAASPPAKVDATTATEPAAAPADTAARDGSAHALGVEQLAVGASAQLNSGPAPSVMPGLGLYARLALHGAGLWAPALQLQLARTWLSGVSETGGDADFAIESAALDACPLGLRMSPLSAHACLSATLGRLTASGSNSYSPRTHHEPWSSLGGRVLLAVGLGGWAELHGGLGLFAPLRRYRFAFRPDVFHHVPGLCLEGHLGAGVRFW